MNKFHPLARARLARWLLVFLVLAGAITAVVWWRTDQLAKKPQLVTSTSSRSVPTTPVGFNKSQYSVNDPASTWVVVNKGRVLPSSYAPSLVSPNVPLNFSSEANDSHLRGEAAKALEALFVAAKKDGSALKLFSGYRSYNQQNSVYSNFVATDGKTQADISSARPGHSEHQTGLAADVSTIGGTCELETCYGDSVDGKWLGANSYKYGFIVRYQKNKQNITGYQYEPWHLRYVGVELATELNKTGQPMEQFFGLPIYDDYPVTNYQLKVGN